jgi:hypothetical protein
MTYFKRKNPFTSLPVIVLRPTQFLKYRLLCIELKVPYFNFKHNDTPDVLEGFSKTEIEKLKNDPYTFFIFDYTNEGESIDCYFNFYNAITLSALKYDIPCNKMFFISSNLLEEETYKQWQSQQQYDVINVLSFNRWNYKVGEIKDITIEHTISNIKEKTNFLSLNRVIRYFRTLVILKLINSSLKNHIQISYDKFDMPYLEEIAALHYSRTGNQIPIQELNDLISSSPSILDRSDFQTNWAISMPTNLFENTLVSLVNETLFDNSSIFYSEKTFKPMMYNHPLLIFGQPNINQSLERIGFKTYEKYFDLSFDNIINYSDRLDKQISYLELLNDQLVSMSTSQKIDWYMQGADILLHNKNALNDNFYNIQQSNKFLSLLKNNSL